MALRTVQDAKLQDSQAIAKQDCDTLTTFSKPRAILQQAKKHVDA